MIAPAFFDENHWGDTFSGGFVTTCGLSNIGFPCTDNGEYYCLHGNLSTMPASSVSTEVVRDEAGIPVLQISGIVNYASQDHPKLSLRRIIRCRQGNSNIEFTDTIMNRGYEAVPVMILYHINIGFPLLSEYTVMEFPDADVISRTKHSES